MDLDELKNRVPVVQLIQGSGVALKGSSDRLQGLCPLHGDKNTPSLTVYPATNTWACFGAGCGSKLGRNNGGDVIEWVIQRYRLSFREAMRWLEDRYAYGVPVKLPTLPAVIPSKSTRVLPFDMVVYWHNMMEDYDRRSWFRSRGFLDETISTEMWGWNGRRYVIPVWEGEPGKSACLGARLRWSEVCDASEPKYIGVAGYNTPTVWGRWHCRETNMILGFAGELDAARAVQDGLPSFSVVNGVNALYRFPEGWPKLWFPNSEFLLVVFDKKEEAMAGQLASKWCAAKGSLSARVIHWPPEQSGKDYCDWRDSGRTAQSFVDMVKFQLGA